MLAFLANDPQHKYLNCAPSGLHDSKLKAPQNSRLNCGRFQSTSAKHALKPFGTCSPPQTMSSTSKTVSQIMEHSTAPTLRTSGSTWQHLAKSQGNVSVYFAMLQATWCFMLSLSFMKVLTVSRSAQRAAPSSNGTPSTAQSSRPALPAAHNY